MNLKAFLFDEDRGVSPVIGVILMVAITVILAAVIATFVMNMGPNEESPPNANFDWEQLSGGGYVLVHDGGEAVDLGELTVSGAATIESSTGEVTAGGDITDDISSGTTGTVTVVWNNPSNDNTQILFEEEVPA